MKRGSALVASVAFAGCCSATGIGPEIDRQVKSSGNSTINLIQFREVEWSQVCFFGPYSNNESFEKAAGFKWPLEQKTDIFTNDGINVIAFIKGNQIVSYTELSRGRADFWRISGQCFGKEQAVFTNEGGNYVGAAPAQQGAQRDGP